MSIIDSPYQIFNLESKDFLNAALSIFQYQAQHCEVYGQYIQALRINPSAVNQLIDIPFLPIQLFKSHQVVSTKKENYLLFESSATTSHQPAKHYIADKIIYETAVELSFEQAFGSPENFVILGLLPHYLERANSSLVYMVDHLIKKSGHKESGFYLHKDLELFEMLKILEKRKQPTVLFGVTFALLDLANKFQLDLEYTHIIETGGMKGRREELTRQAVHEYLKRAFGAKPIFSEYGMAEILTPSYMKAKNQFKSPSWMRVLVRDVYDPFDIRTNGKGAINIIDLANIHSCSFIATDDLGQLDSAGLFKVLGRVDASEIRGCNLLLNE